MMLTSILRGLSAVLSGSSFNHVGFIVLSTERAVRPHRAYDARASSRGMNSMDACVHAASQRIQGSPYKAGVDGGRLLRGLYLKSLISRTAVTNKVRRALRASLDAPTTPLSHLYP